MLMRLLAVEGFSIGARSLSDGLFFRASTDLLGSVQVGYSASVAFYARSKARLETERKEAYERREYSSTWGVVRTLTALRGSCGVWAIPAVPL